MGLDITVLLDRSGSMQSRKDDHEGGLKSFIQDNKDKTDTYFTFIQFDSNQPFELIYDRVSIQDVDLDKIQLIPRGGTPLHDALGKTIAHIEQRKNNDAKMIFVVSDGEENQSREWNGERVKQAIESKTDWKFLFLGTDQDAVTTGSSLGISAASAMNYSNTTRGVSNLYRASTQSLGRAHHALCSGASINDVYMASNFTAEERTACADNNTTTTTGPTSTQTS